MDEIAVERKGPHSSAPGFKAPGPVRQTAEPPVREAVLEHEDDDLTFFAALVVNRSSSAVSDVSISSHSHSMIIRGL
jgi:hypothetical protein